VLSLQCALVELKSHYRTLSKSELWPKPCGLNMASSFDQMLQSTEEMKLALGTIPQTSEKQLDVVSISYSLLHVSLSLFPDLAVRIVHCQVKTPGGTGVFGVFGVKSSRPCVSLIARWYLLPRSLVMGVSPLICSSSFVFPILVSIVPVLPDFLHRFLRFRPEPRTAYINLLYRLLAFPSSSIDLVRPLARLRHDVLSPRPPDSG